MKGSRSLFLVMLSIIFVTVSMELDEILVVEGAAYSSIEFPDGKKVRIFRSTAGNLIQANEESVAELFQEKLCLLVRLKNRRRTTINKFPEQITSTEDMRMLKCKIGIMLDPNVKAPGFLMSPERLHQENAVIIKYSSS